MEIMADKDEKTYRRLKAAIKNHPEGCTVADLVGRTALPVEKVKELLPAAASEFSARIRVTESGEILYNFPKHLKSKYTGFGVTLRRVAEAVNHGVQKAAVFLFKAWIMVMLVGYFALFMLIAIAAMLLSVAASASNNNERRDSGGGLYLFSGILNMIIRIWFYSELTRSLNQNYYGYGARQQRARPKGKPLYKAIFSFVFGDGDINADIETREKQAFIAYVQANNGVISLPEFMTITGLPPARADEKIVAYCAQFGGSPEATEDGTVAYTFDQLLPRADRTDTSYAAFSAPLKRLGAFSSNPKKLNIWFGVINSVNLLFGGYFFYHTFKVGHILSREAFNASPAIYRFTYQIFHLIAPGIDPLPVLTYGLGAVPLVFSVLFWIIPAIRWRVVQKENERVKMANLRKAGYKAIVDKRLEVRPSDIRVQAAECTPKNLNAAKEQVLKEIGCYAVPELAVDEAGETVYTFTSLDRELAATARYRAAHKDNSALGGIVFDTAAAP
ncbi:MAG: hypothetical protein LBC72_02315 [Spirochaetaceae bacterium]|jgi:hypothetical protein|nr:hypothetical protein [Spirochaetaceae bacterium]